MRNNNRDNIILHRSNRNLRFSLVQWKPETMKVPTTNAQPNVG